MGGRYATPNLPRGLGCSSPLDRRQGLPVSDSEPVSDCTFRPEVVEAMRAAYRMACDALQLKWGADERTAIIAVKIIELAQAGETDARRLCTEALRRLTH